MQFLILVLYFLYCHDPSSKNFLIQKKNIPHTIHGIIDNEECSLNCDLANVEIQFRDSKNNVSNPIHVLMAFSSRENVPYLIGLKGILDTCEIQIKSNHCIFKIG